MKIDLKRLKELASIRAGSLDRCCLVECHATLPALIAAVEALRDLKQEVDNLSGIELTRDIETYKAQAVWDDVNDNAIAALKPFEAKP